MGGRTVRGTGPLAPFIPRFPPYGHNATAGPGFAANEPSEPSELAGFGKLPQESSAWRPESVGYYPHCGNLGMSTVRGLGLAGSPGLVNPASEAADLAASGPGGGIDGEIARAAVRAAIGSGGGDGSAPKSAHCDGAARDRCGRGSRMHSCSFWSRVSRALQALGAASRPVLLHGPNQIKDRSGSWFPCPERWRERVGLYRRFASADL